MITVQPAALVAHLVCVLDAPDISWHDAAHDEAVVAVQHSSTMLLWTAPPVSANLPTLAASAGSQLLLLPALQIVMLACHTTAHVLHSHCTLHLLCL